MDGGAGKEQSRGHRRGAHGEKGDVKRKQRGNEYCRRQGFEVVSNSAEPASYDELGDEWIWAGDGGQWQR